jgi:hypothetical protein
MNDVKREGMISSPRVTPGRHLALAALLPLCAFAEPAVFPNETDSASPRKSLLPNNPDAVVLRTDLDADGDPDLIERWRIGVRHSLARDFRIRPRFRGWLRCHADPAFFAGDAATDPAAGNT